MAQETDEERRGRKLAVNVALIAALSGLGGAAVGGGVAYVTTSKQLDAQAEQSRQDFLNSKRPDVYSRAYAATQLAPKFAIIGAQPDPNLPKASGASSSSHIPVCTKEDLIGLKRSVNAIDLVALDMELYGSNRAHISLHNFEAYEHQVYADCAGFLYGKFLPKGAELSSPNLPPTPPAAAPNSSDTSFYAKEAYRNIDNLAYERANFIMIVRQELKTQD